MRHTEQEGAGEREEEVMLAAELATGAYRKSEMMRSGAADAPELTIICSSSVRTLP